MLKENSSRNFSEHFIPILNDYLAVGYFLNRGESIPDAPDLYEYIYSGSDNWAFMDYLVATIHRIVFDEFAADEIKTQLGLHVEDMRTRNKKIRVS